MLMSSPSSAKFLTEFAVSFTKRDAVSMWMLRSDALCFASQRDHSALTTIVTPRDARASTNR